MLDRRDLISAGEAARILGKSVARVHQYEKAGLLKPYIRMANGWRIYKRSAVEKFAKSRHGLAGHG